MGVLINPRGTAIADPGRYDLARGAVKIFGTGAGDHFIFLDAPHEKVVIGLGGSNVYDAAATDPPVHARYYDYLRLEEWTELADGRPWEPWRGIGQTSVFNVGSFHDVKPGLGTAIVRAHGGRFETPLRVWVQNDSSLIRVRVYIDGTKTVTDFETKPAKRAGSRWAAELVQVTVRGASGNRISNGQLAELRATDQGAYYSDRTTNVWRPVMVPCAASTGPTRAEMQRFVDGWAVLP